MGITAFPFSSVIDVPTARILGRDDAGTGSAGDFASANQSDFDMFTAGLFDIMNSATNDLENLLNRECSDCLADDTEKPTDITE